MNAPETSAGFVNAHTHLYGALAPFGLPTHPPGAPFLDILRTVWWRLDRALDQRSLRAAARWHVAEALLHGTTALVDHHESPSFIEGSLDVLADACDELGIRALLCYGASERNGGREEAARGLAECRRFARANTRPLVRGLVGLHASFTVSDETIREAGVLCRELGTVLHAHVAEDIADVRDAHDRGQHGPLERLQALGALGRGAILAHGVHLDEAQVRGAEALGCWIVQNPRSNEHNRVGYPRALWASRRVALGTDGHRPDMSEELAALIRSAARQRGAERGDAAELWTRLDAGRDLAAQWFGDEALRLDEVVLDDHRPGAHAHSAPGPGGGIRPATAWSVTIAGRPVVRTGRLLTGDLEEIRDEARSQAVRVRARMETIA